MSKITAMEQNKKAAVKAAAILGKEIKALILYASSVDSNEELLPLVMKVFFEATRVMKAIEGINYEQDASSPTETKN